MKKFRKKPNPKPKKKQARRSVSKGDMIATGCLGTIAAAAFLFPWHVHFNPDSYEPPQMVFSRDRMMEQDLLLAFASGQALFDLETGTLIAGSQFLDEVDPIATGTVPGAEDDEPPQVRQIELGPDDPATISLISATRQRALVTDGTSIWLIGPGDRLPGVGTVSALDLRDGKASLLTSGGQSIRQLGAQ